MLWTFTSGGGASCCRGYLDDPDRRRSPVTEGTMASLVSDFAHPAGNVTGLTLNSLEQHEECLQLLSRHSPYAGS